MVFGTFTVFGAYNTAGNRIDKESGIYSSSVGWQRVLTMHNYSDSNRWSQSVVDGQLAMEYQYNPLGQRIAKSSGGILQERYDYGANGELDVVRDGQNNPLRHYLYMNGKLVGLYDYTVSQLFYVHHDHLGTPHKVTNQAQQVVWSADDRPFGEVESVGGEEVFSRFPGQYHDVETGFYYNYFRDYDPSIGRYIQSDPIGLEGAINTYAYVHNNPISAYDPTGLAACYVNFPDYPIEYAEGRTSTSLGGHSGVLGYDDKGDTRYYEYGRYSSGGKHGYMIGEKLPSKDGNARLVTMPNLEIGPDGKPTVCAGVKPRLFAATP